jgi:8-hydroxy-5-deazaflavin:NADPH oxidoreductase
MKIGILGAGKIGATVGRLWSKAGHQLRFGTRHPAQLAALAAELGASAGTPEEAVAFAEVVLLAVPLKAVPDLAKSARFSGRVVLDAINAYLQRDGKLAEDALAHPGGSSAWIAEKLAGARIVKAFNSVNFGTLASEAHRKGDRVAIPLAGDDADAMRIAEQLVREAGFEPVAGGALAAGERFQPGTKVYNTGMSAKDARRALELS